MKQPSRDYHDYVFRNGKLVAEFEEMYRNSFAVPWHQDEQEKWIDIQFTINMLRELGPFSEIHDFGCGTGHYLSILMKQLGFLNSRGFGYDISKTACEKAMHQFPNFNFQVLDLMNLVNCDVMELKNRGERKLFVIRGTLWYVFPSLNQVIKNIRKFMCEGDLLLVVQNFPPLDKPFIGKDVIPSHRALIEHFSEFFSLVRHIWYEDTLKLANDNWFIGLFSIRD